MTAGRVAVLKGGRSLERNVSLRSGAHVQEALQRLGREVLALDAGPELIAEVLATKPDAAFIALHGRDGEDGTVQGLLEAVGTPYTGSGPAGCMRCTDKLLAKHLMREAGVPTPHFHSLREASIKQLGAAAAIADIERGLGFPLVVKPAVGGSALGVKFARTSDELPGALVGAFSYDGTVLIEIRTAERRVTTRAEVTQPHRQVVDTDTTGTVEIDGRDRRSTDLRAIGEHLAAAMQRRRGAGALAATEHGERHGARDIGKLARRLAGAVHGGACIELNVAETQIRGAGEIDHDRSAVDRVVGEIPHDDRERPVRIRDPGLRANRLDVGGNRRICRTRHARHRDRGDEKTGRSKERSLANQTSHCCTSLKGENLLHCSRQGSVARNQVWLRATSFRTHIFISSFEFECLGELIRRASKAFQDERSLGGVFARCQESF